MLEINKVHLWDCLELMKQIPDWSIDAIITDPPYEVSVNGWWTVNNIKKLNKSLNEWIVKANIVSWYDYDWVFEQFDRLQKNINIYIFCWKKQIMRYMERYVTNKKCTFDILFRHKNNALPTYFNKYLTDCEYLLHFRKWASCHPKSYEDAKTVYLWSINHKDKKLYGHPTIKPLDLIEKIIRNSTNEWDLVLDPFMWSWTTAVACKNMNRNFVWMEISQEYVNTANNRLHNSISLF